MAVTAVETAQSQWAVIWRQFRRRRLAVVCAGVILLLATISIFAPFLANDRPLYYRGVNRFEFREAVRTLREVVRRLAEEKNLSPDARGDLVTSVHLQLRLMRPGLTADAQPQLDELRGELLSAIDQSDSARLRALRTTIQSVYGRKDLTLASRTYWPVLVSLHWRDLLFMTGNVLLLTAPVWWRIVNRCVPAHKPHRRNRIAALIGLGLPIAAAGLWYLIVPARIDQTNYKAGVLAADETAATALVVYESVLWPPIPYGLDEGDLSRKLAKPAAFAKDDPNAKPSSPWNGPHWLGTNSLGRDVLCRMIWGGRVSLSVGIVAVAIYVSIGIVVGAVAGYFRGFWDLIISRIIEVVICFPAFFLILTIVAFLGPGIWNIMIVIGLTGWTGIARLIRGEFLRLVDQEFVLAGRALGYSPARLIFKHILPNAMAPVLVSATFGVAGAILTESALSFLGLGITPPTPSWGEMLSSGRDAMFHAPWLIWYPGLAIFVTISSYNLVGEALRDASDPRLRGSR